MDSLPARLVVLTAALLWLVGCGSGVPQIPNVTVTPANVNLQAGAGTQQFTAIVSNTSNPSVVWKVNGTPGGNASVGTITTGGLYSTPATVPATNPVTVTATSVADPNESASATVTLSPGVTVTISPTTASLGVGGKQQFTATVTNAANTNVTWSVNSVAGGNSTVGTISAQGLYVAPAAFPGLSQVTITVASVQDPGETAQAIVQLQSPASISIMPASVTVNLGATQPFSATVTGLPSSAVNWSVDGVAGGNSTLGTINGQGVFSAPSVMPSPVIETVTATSQANAGVSGSATVTLQTPPTSFSISPANATLSVGKAASVTQTYQVTVSPGFSNPISFAVAGLPVNVNASLSSNSITGSGSVTLTLTTASISLAVANVPVILTATSTSGGASLVQTATVLLSITGWAGQVNTLAGGPGGVGFQDGSGTDDELEAWGITTDGSHTLYFVDKRGSALRSLDISSGAVATLVGGPYFFTFQDGNGLVFDSSSQTLYVADGVRNQIVKYILGDQSVSVLAGSGVAGFADGVGAAAQFAYPHGLAMSADGSTLYVADTDNETIRAVAIATGAVTTIAGTPGIYRSTDGTGAAANFCQPTGLDIDSAGANLYVSDGCGFVIRRIALANAAVTTVAGNGNVGLTDGSAASASFSNLNGLKVDPHSGANLLYIADANAIRVLTLGADSIVYTLAGAAASGQTDGSATIASFYAPLNISVIPDVTGGNTSSLFIADSANGLVRRLDFSNPLSATSTASANVTVSTIAGQSSHRGSADGPGTGAGYASPSTAEFDQPSQVVTDGKIAYVVDSNNGAIREIDLNSTTVSTVAGPHQGYADGPASTAAFFQPSGLAWVPAQNVIYIADTGNGAIRKLDLAAQMVSTVAGAAAAGYADGPLLSARFNHPFGIVAGADGSKLYVADTGNNAIRLIDLNSGTVSTIAGNGGLGSADGIGAAARFAEPNGLTFDSTENILYISDFENHAIRQLNLTTGVVTTLAGSDHHCGATDGPVSSASLCTPALIATDGRSIFWGDYDTGLFRVLDIATGVVSTLAGSPSLMHMVDGLFTEAPGELIGAVRYNGVFGLAIYPDDSAILFADKTANVIRIIH